MKSVTEFNSFSLAQGNKTKATLAAEGKTPEEIQVTLGTTFKMEGDKLKHFTNALEVASQNAEGLKRVLVVTLAEGEAAPAKATQVEEVHYVPEFIIDPKKNPAPADSHKGGKGGRRGGKDRGPKESPWGLSPEQKAAKKGKQTAAAAEAKK